MQPKSGSESLSKELHIILDSTKGEREISAFLAKNPILLRNAVCSTVGHSTYIMKEFPFGSIYRADFVVVTSYSGKWVVHMSELEPHNDKVITGQGLPSQKLNTALRQIRDWSGYIDKNLSFRNYLATACMEKDLLKDPIPGKMPTNFTGNRLNDPNTTINFHNHIFIGNRRFMSEKKYILREQLANQVRVNISTYNSFIDIAEKL